MLTMTALTPAGLPLRAGDNDIALVIARIDIGLAIFPRLTLVGRRESVNPGPSIFGHFTCSDRTSIY